MVRPKPRKEPVIPKDKARTMVWVDKDIFKAFKLLAVEQELTFSHALENAMADYIKKHGKEIPHEKP